MPTVKIRDGNVYSTDVRCERILHPKTFSALDENMSLHFRILHFIGEQEGKEVGEWGAGRW